MRSADEVGGDRLTRITEEHRVDDVLSPDGRKEPVEALDMETVHAEVRTPRGQGYTAGRVAGMIMTTFPRLCREEVDKANGRGQRDRARPGLDRGHCRRSRPGVRAHSLPRVQGQPVTG